MNAGTGLVRGDVVIFLDADDVLEPHAVERIARAFADDPDLVRVHYRLRVMDALGRDTGEIKPPLRLGLARRQPGPPDASHAIRRRVAPDQRERVLGPRPETDPPDPRGRLPARRRLVPGPRLVAPRDRSAPSRSRSDATACTGRTASPAPAARLDLEHLSETVGYAESTRRHLLRNARLAGIDHDARRTASMCDVANRAVLMRVGPRAARGDRDSRMGLRGSGRGPPPGRRDVGPADEGHVPPLARRHARRTARRRAVARRALPAAGAPPGHQPLAGRAPPLVRILLVTPMPPSLEAPGAIPRLLHACVTGLGALHEITLVTRRGPRPVGARGRGPPRGDRPRRPRRPADAPRRCGAGGLAADGSCGDGSSAACRGARSGSTSRRSSASSIG